MHLSLHTDYAIRTLMYLAASSTKPITISHIASFYNISKNHLIKIVHKLSKMGVIETTRGRAGGLKLGLRAEEINIGHLVRRLENPALVECFSQKNNCAIHTACRLKQALNRALESFYAELDKLSLDQLVADNTMLQMLVDQGTQHE